MKGRQYCVYIMTNAHNTVLYTGVTNSLQRRVLEHKSSAGSKFAKNIMSPSWCILNMVMM